MSENQNTEYAVLVDRALNDIDRPREINYNNFRRVLKAGQVEITVPREVAVWLTRHATQHHVHDADTGEYKCRFAIKEAAEDLVAYLGPEAFDTEAFERDLDRAEGWDTGAIDNIRGPVRLLSDKTDPRLRARAGDFPNQGQAGSKVGLGER